MREITTDGFMGSGAGKQGPTPGRVLTFADQLYRKKAIDVDRWMAAGTLRNMIMMEIPPSEGVLSYGSNVKASEPSGKADRVGRRHTGYQIQPDGEIRYAGGRRSRSNERALEDAIFAACGLHDAEGKRRVNLVHAELLIRIVTHTESMPTLAAITQELTDRYGPKSKQGPAYAFGVVETLLGRLAQHLRHAK